MVLDADIESCDHSDWLIIVNVLPEEKASKEILTFEKITSEKYL